MMFNIKRSQLMICAVYFLVLYIMCFNAGCVKRSKNSHRDGDQVIIDVNTKEIIGKLSNTQEVKLSLVSFADQTVIATCSLQPLQNTQSCKFNNLKQNTEYFIALDLSLLPKNINYIYTFSSISNQADEINGIAKVGSRFIFNNQETKFSIKLINLNDANIKSMNFTKVVLKLDGQIDAKFNSASPYFYLTGEYCYNGLLSLDSSASSNQQNTFFIRSNNYNSFYQGFADSLANDYYNIDAIEFIAKPDVENQVKLTTNKLQSSYQVEFSVIYQDKVTPPVSINMYFVGSKYSYLTNNFSANDKQKFVFYFIENVNAAVKLNTKNYYAKLNDINITNKIKQNTITISSKIPTPIGWDTNKVTMGSVWPFASDAVNADFVKYASNKTVGALFTYGDWAGNISGGDAEGRNKFFEKSAKAENMFKIIHNDSLIASKIYVHPVIIFYMASASTSHLIGALPDLNEYLENHYASLVGLAVQLQSYVAQGYYSSILLSPDYLGELENCDNQHIPARCFPTNLENQVENYQVDVNNKLQLALKSALNAKIINAIPDVPKFKDTLYGYHQSTNWIITTFAKDISFSWPINPWAKNSGHAFIHQIANLGDKSRFNLKKEISSRAKFLTRIGVAGGNFPSTFLSIDKYERNEFTNGQHYVEQGYMYSVNDWDVYINFITGIARELFMPVMLFQTPGGHLQSKHDTKYPKDNHASTAASYFVGSSDLNNLSDISDYIMNWSVQMSLAIYGMQFDKAGEYLRCNQQNINDVSCWKQNRIKDPQFQSVVFAILWGGGDTSSVIKNLNHGFDDGWLANRLAESNM